MPNRSKSGEQSIHDTCSASVHAFIENVNRESIIAIALSTHLKILPPTGSPQPISCTLDPDPKTGTFNAVWFIDYNDGVQWVFRTPFTDWSPALEKRFQSDIWGMQLIQSRTSVPIPRIIDFSVSQDNPFGRPYLIMERVNGVPLHELWFDSNWFSDEKRKKVFTSLASTMSQLKTLEFKQIGSIYYENSEYSVGPLLPAYQAIINDQTNTRGPYNSVHSFLMDTLSQESSTLDRRFQTTLRILAGCIPDERLDGPPFVLSMPDYDIQNVYIDNDSEGNVTGLLDWDDLVVGPREAGYAKFPFWLTRDIDIPFNGFDFQMAALHRKSFPPREEVLQDWPNVLPGYRAEFLDVFKEIDADSAAYVRDSHLVSPLIQEIFSIFAFGRIECNLFSHMFFETDRLFSDVFERGIGRGGWTDDATLDGPESGIVEYDVAPIA